jgi:hypothetical protein
VSPGDRNQFSQTGHGHRGWWHLFSRRPNGAKSLVRPAFCQCSHPRNIPNNWRGCHSSIKKDADVAGPVADKGGFVSQKSSIWSELAGSPPRHEAANSPEPKNWRAYFRTANRSCCPTPDTKCGTKAPTFAERMSRHSWCALASSRAQLQS